MIASPRESIATSDQPLVGVVGACALSFFDHVALGGLASFVLHGYVPQSSNPRLPSCDCLGGPAMSRSSC